jgi:hypothetical protein
VSRPAALGIAAVCEDDVAEDEQAPTIAEHLGGGVSGTPTAAHTLRPYCLHLHNHQVLRSWQAVANHKRKEPRAEAGRGGCADP